MKQMAELECPLDCELRMLLRHTGAESYRIRFCSRDCELASVCLTGRQLRTLLQDRQELATEPVTMSPQGRDVVIDIAGARAARIKAGELQDMVLRSIRNAV